MSRTFSTGLLLVLSLPLSAQPRLDAYGDPLPDGASARFGSQRFRPCLHSHYRDVVVSPDGTIFVTLERTGFRFWDLATGGEIGLVTPVDKHYAPKSIAFSPDGKRFALSEYKHGDFPKYLYSIRVGETSTRKILWSSSDVKQDMSDFGWPVFAAGGKIIVAYRQYLSDEDRAGCCLLNAGSGEVIGRHDTLCTFKVSSDGKKLALGKPNGNVVLLDAATNKELKTFKALSCPVSDLAWSPDDKRIAVGGELTQTTSLGPFNLFFRWFESDNRVCCRVWEVTADKDVAADKSIFYKKAPEQSISGLAFSPDGRLLSAWLGYGIEVLWELETSKELGRFDIDYGSRLGPPKLLSRCTLVDGTRLAIERLSMGLLRVRAEMRDAKPLWAWPDCQTYVPSYDLFRVIDVETGRDRAGHSGHRRPIRDLHFAADGSYLISADENDIFRVWKTADGSLLGGPAEQEKRWAEVRFLDDGKLVFVGKNGMIRVWDVAANRLAKSFIVYNAIWHGGSSDVGGFDLTKDGVLAYQIKTGVELWDAVQGQQLASLSRRSFSPLKIAFSPDRRFLFSGGYDDELLLGNAAGKELRRWTTEYMKSNLQQPTFSPDSRWLAWNDFGNGHISCFNLANEKTLEIAGKFDQLAFLSDGSALATYDRDKGTRLWKLPEGEELKCVVPNVKGGDRWDNRFHASANGKMFLTSHLWNDGRVFEVVDGRMIFSGFRYQQSGGSYMSWPIDLLSFSPDGRLVAIALKGLDLTVYEIASAKPVGKLPQGHRGHITALAFSADGKTLATGGHEGTILLWDWAAACGLASKDDRTLEALWSDMLDADPAKAYRALFALQARSRDAVGFLGKQLKAAADAEPGRFRRLIAALDADDFRTRDRAMKELQRAGLQAEPFVRAAYGPTNSAEVQSRLDTLLADPRLCEPGPELLRELRAIQALKWIGTRESAALIEELAAQSPEWMKARDAKCSSQGR